MLKYFGFQEEPFGVTPDPRCLFLSRTHQDALTALERGFSSNRGFTAMIAPPGMGKTTLLFRFLEDTRQTARTVFLFDIDALCEPREFVSYILRDIGITPSQSSAERHDQLSAALEKENKAGRKFVILIDEAQNLSDAVMERVRLLTNFETSRGKLMHIILSGQPQLAEKLMSHSQLQLRQRITTLCRIEPLAAEEIVPYIDYRVKIAGYQGAPLFTEGALNLLAEASYGTPRTINNLCYSALYLCQLLGHKQVDGGMVAKVLFDLQMLPKRRDPEPEPVPVAVSTMVEEEQQPLEPVEVKRRRPLLKHLIPHTAGSVMLWVPVALLLGTGVFGAFRTTGARAPLAPATSIDQSQDWKAQPAPANSAASGSETIITEPIPGPAPSEPAPPVHVASVPATPLAMQPGTHAPKPSPATAQPAAPGQKPLTIVGSIPKLPSAPQALMMLQENAAPPPSFPAADANPAPAQESPASATQNSTTASASSAKPVRPALAGSTPEVLHPTTAPTVHAALPGNNP